MSCVLAKLLMNQNLPEMSSPDSRNAGYGILCSVHNSRNSPLKNAEYRTMSLLTQTCQRANVPTCPYMRRAIRSSEQRCKHIQRAVNVFPNSQLESVRIKTEPPLLRQPHTKHLQGRNKPRYLILFH